MRNWKITGLAAMFLIVLAPALYLAKQKYFPAQNNIAGRILTAAFVGAEKCSQCHRQEYLKWRNSDHRHAMAVASNKTVRGNFDNAVFEHHGVTSRFYRKKDRFFVHTQGPGGVMGDFEIKYTFGWTPLQQYLVPFPGGRLQCLPIAWDVRKKRWYHLYPDRQIDPGDWLYWTRAGLNWNGMCAECHLTNLKKGYHPDSDTYQTTWSEINVSCEACHGPGSLHVKWAELPEMGRPDDPNYGLTVRTRGLSSREQVDLCAYCHARRASLSDYRPANRKDPLDFMLPRLLDADLYFADGQILAEDYVYGSFTQSKMHMRGVRCSNCHDVHSGKRLKEGNALCLQCHQAALYDTKAHHFHKKKGEAGKPIRSAGGKLLFAVGSGARCENCHMPGRIYMGIDYRADHSFRLPRPDLSLALGVPNACNRCHIHQTARWADDYIVKWYGKKRRFHYGTVFAAGRQADPQAKSDLIRLSGDRLYPTIVRATALSLLGAYDGKDVREAFTRALNDETSLMRQTALHHLPPFAPQQRMAAVGPLLDDPVKGVRIEAARNLTAVPGNRLDKRFEKTFATALTEFQQAMTYSADFAASRQNLGTIDSYLGKYEQAEANFKKAIAIDRDFYPAQLNLSVVYSRQGKTAKAEALLRRVLKRHPQLADAHYSLGLLLAEKKQWAQAVEHLAKAAQGLPYRSRVQYNLGQLLAFLGKDRQAEAALSKALEIQPDNMDYLAAAARFYIQRKNFSVARRIAKKMQAVQPSNPMGAQLLKFIDHNRKHDQKGVR